MGAIQLGRQKFAEDGGKLCFAPALPVQNTTISSLYTADEHFADPFGMHHFSIIRQDIELQTVSMFAFFSWPSLDRNGFPHTEVGIQTDGIGRMGQILSFL
jgi:hypothetical protein